MKKAARPAGRAALRAEPAESAAVARALTVASDSHGRRKRRARTIGFRQIATILIAEIQDNRWAVNDVLPSEMELVERFTVGRNTVREALRELQNLGYIKRRRGARSVLATVSPDLSFVNSVSTVGELLEYAKNTKATVLATETIRLDERLARRLDCQIHSEWLRIGLLRSRDTRGPAFCYSEIYLDPAYGDVVSRMGPEGQIYTLIESVYGVLIRRVEQETEAVAADANIASRLGIPVDSAILLVRTKFYSSEGKLVETGLSHFPSGRYRVRIVLDRRVSLDSA